MRPWMAYSCLMRAQRRITVEMGHSNPIISSISRGHVLNDARTPHVVVQHHARARKIAQPRYNLTPTPEYPGPERLCEPEKAFPPLYFS